jgi:lipopolysaccharide/colanic/teichoic acid biosynthesis glycosyltransferase
MIKRLFDMVCSGVALIALAPVFLVVAILIKCDSPGPVFYRQERLGRGRRPFLIFKFRTMVDGADRQGPAVSVGGDSRITRIGAVLRRFEIDELPTLLNVFRGEMSIVGPRPEASKYLPLYTEEQKRVFTVRPGMTDPGTLKFRDEGRLLARADDPEDLYVAQILPAKLQENLTYVEKQSLGYDLALIFRTIGQILVQKK